MYIYRIKQPTPQMVLRTCECCLFSTNYKHVYDKHMKSKRHYDIQNDVGKPVKIFSCKNCNKKYKTQSGLWKHANVCIAVASPVDDTVTTLVVGTVDPPIKLEEPTTIELLHKQLSDIQSQITNLQPSTTTNNTNNTTNNNHIHIYLNTHCNNAMSIDQFVDSMKFVKDDFNEIDNNRFYYKGATNILKKYFEQLKPEDRPMHCAFPIVNKPASFFVRDENEWKEECQSMIHYQIKYIEEFDNKEDQLVIARFFDRFNEKLYDTYKEFSRSDKQMERRINDKMMGGGSKDKIDMLDELVDSKTLVLRPSG